MALLLLRQMTVSATARQTGETDKRLWRMQWAHVGVAYPKADFSAVTCVGCNEMSVRKGHRYISVFCDLIGRRVLFACEGKDKTRWEKFARELEAHDGHHRAIRQVSIDMSPAYIAGVDNYIGSQALIVFDKFHVIAKVNEAVDSTRKAAQRLADKDQRMLLKKSRWPLLKNPENLTDKQLALYEGTLLKSSLCAVKALQMLLVLQDIYAIPEQNIARSKLRAWCRWVEFVASQNLQPLFADILKCSNMIRNHLDGILAHWLDHITNAFMAGRASTPSSPPSNARLAASPPSLTSSPCSTFSPLTSTSPLPSENIEKS